MNHLHPAPVLAVFVALLGAGCQTVAHERRSDQANATQASELTTPQTDFSEAVMQPFNDFNIMRDPIPEPLKQASKRPYAEPADSSCAAIAAETARLDSALGPDLDVNDGDDDDGNGIQVSSMAAGALRSLTTGWIPFRGILRRVTGAEAHAREAREAILAGAVRRAYLKGLGERSGCAPPAAPHRKAPKA